MADFSSPHSPSEPSPLTGPSSLGSAVDPQALATVHEVPHHKATYADDTAPPDHQLQSTGQLYAASRDASLSSSMGQSYNEKQTEGPPQRLRHISPTEPDRDALQRSQVSHVQRRDGDYHRHTTTSNMSAPRTPKKDRKGGFRNTLRRMFSRRSTKDRISMPSSTVYPQHDPEEFITSAADIKTTRSASVPSHGLMRTSGLTSHPPHQSVPSPAVPAPVVPLTPPPQPERRPPERPVRPRNASVPSLIIDKQEPDALESAMATRPGLQAPREQSVDVRNIGFAVTNGSNPKRRSRSAEAFGDSEHRTSPIQWRRWRRRSDEIRYWRQSEDLTPLGLKSLDSSNMAHKGEGKAIGESGGELEEQNKDFNFGLPSEPLQHQERIGLEERVITLEIKLMDFEYALSKLQAGSSSPLRRHSHPVGSTKRQESQDSYFSSETPQSVDASPALPQGTPPTSPSKFVHETTPKPRPTSVATTLKPSSSGPYVAHRKESSMDRSVRSSLTSLTIDHYTTLITLIRHEQSARVRLEQQVSQLQRRLDQFSPVQPSHSHAHSLSQHSHSRSISSTQRRRGFVEVGDRGRGPIWQQRPRSSSYSTTGTDTDDSAYHDVYSTPGMTPVERGEYERGAFERVAGVEEGVAF